MTAPIVHPGWCAGPEGGCTVNADGTTGAHQSVTLTVTRDDGSGRRTDMFVDASVLPGTHAVVVVEMYDEPDEEPTVVAWRVPEAERVVERLGALLEQVAS